MNGITFVGSFYRNDVKKVYENIQRSGLCEQCIAKMREGDASVITHSTKQCCEICSTNNIEKYKELQNLFTDEFNCISDKIVYMVMNCDDERFKNFFHQ